MAVVLITGCSSGFGLVTAVSFAQAGDTVYATMRSLGKRAALLEACRDAGVEVNTLELDVTDDASVRTAVANVLDSEGRIDVLVNNAGCGWLYAVETLPEDLLRQTFEVNVFGVVRMLRAVLPQMRSQGSGVIVNITSRAAHLATPFMGLYPAAKHALRALSESLSMEVEDFGVKVAIVEPGFFRTNIVADQDAHPLDSESPYLLGETKNRQRVEHGVNHGGDPQEIADLIVSVAHSPNPKLHNLVDPQAAVAARFEMDDVEWSRFMRRSIGY